MDQDDSDLLVQKVQNDSSIGSCGLEQIGCWCVSIFRGGGIEAKFEDGSIIHVAPCASSFLLQLQPHRDTPYGCGLHKVNIFSHFNLRVLGTSNRVRYHCNRVLGSFP